MGLPKLHVITNGLAASRLGGVLAAGPMVVQVRAKGLNDLRLFRLAVEVVELCAQRGGWCIVNDRLDIALAVGATGVHLGAEDLPLEVARKVAGEALWIGGTARDSHQARRLEAEGATYLGVGPAYSTPSKRGLPEPLGPGGVAEVAEVVGIPVIAIGGVTPERVPELLEAGAHGVAVISAVWEAPDPAGAAARLLGLLGETR